MQNPHLLKIFIYQPPWYNRICMASPPKKKRKEKSMVGLDVEHWCVSKCVRFLFENCWTQHSHGFENSKETLEFWILILVGWSESKLVYWCMFLMMSTSIHCKWYYFTWLAFPQTMIKWKFLPSSFNPVFVGMTWSSYHLIVILFYHSWISMVVESCIFNHEGSHQKSSFMLFLRKMMDPKSQMMDPNNSFLSFLIHP